MSNTHIELTIKAMKENNSTIAMTINKVLTESFSGYTFYKLYELCLLHEVTIDKLLENLLTSKEYSLIIRILKDKNKNLEYLYQTDDIHMKWLSVQFQLAEYLWRICEIRE